MIPVIEKKWNYIQRWDFFFFFVLLWWLYILNYTRPAKSILLELQQHTARHFSISTFPYLWRMDPLEQRERIWGSEQSNEALTTIHVRLHGVLFIQIIDLIGLWLMRSWGWPMKPSFEYHYRCSSWTCSTGHRCASHRSRYYNFRLWWSVVEPIR